MQEKMWSHLQDPVVQSQLRQRLQEVGQSITIDIKQAAKITCTTPAQLRHWETLELISPKRTSTSARSGDRRYSLHDLVTLLIINELQNQTANLATISQFKRDEDRFIEELIDQVTNYEKDSNELPQNILQYVNQTEDALLWQIFVPRAMYLSICLLFEQTISGDAGLVLPVPDSHAYLEHVRFHSIKNLTDLGEVLIGWHSSNHPFCSFLANRTVLEPARQYPLVPLDWPLKNNAAPKNTYLIVEGKFEYLLEKARANVLKAVTSANARKAAGRLLKLVQESASKWKPFLQSAGIFMAYYSSDFADPQLGDHLLNGMAEIVIQLGGMQEVQQEERWRFCCILLPDNPLASPKEQNLVLQAQSRNSPHPVNETFLSPDEQKSISMKAFQSGRIMYRQHVADEEPDMAWLKREGEVRSAIAVPIEGMYGQPIGVLYIASYEEDAFSEDDQLLLRMIGRIIAEQILTLQARNLLVVRLPDVITHPQIVDRFFKEFHSESEFMSEIEKLLGQVMLKTEGEIRVVESYVDTDERAFDSLSFIAVDIDNLNVHAKTNRTMRNLVLEVGRRIQQWIDQDRRTLEEIQLYRMFADRFYLFLKNTPLRQAIKYAGQLQKMLREPKYHIEASRLSREQHISSENKLTLEIKVRLGVTGYSYERLQEILRKDRQVANTRVRLTRSLDEALRRGKEAGGDNITAWDLDLGRFTILSDDEALNSQDHSLPLQRFFMNGEIQDDLIRKLGDALFPYLLDRLRREPEAGLFPPDKGEV